MVLPAHGGDHEPRRQLGYKLAHRAAGNGGIADRDLAVGEPGRYRRLQFRPKQHLGEVHADDGTDDAERIGDAVTDGGLGAARSDDRGLQRGGAGHRAGKHAREIGGWKIGDQREHQHHGAARRKRHEGQQVPAPARAAGDAADEVPAVLDAGAIEEHNEAQ
jgi:hypothetical protein